MSLKLNSSGGGSVTLQEPTTANNQTLTLPDVTGTLLVDGTAISGTTGSFSGNFSFNSGYGSAAVAYGCRAWVNFNGTGTVAIRASGNVSSITDNGTGDYTVNFSTAMADANYQPTVNIQRGDGAGVNPGYGCIYATAANAYTSITTGSVRVITANSATAAMDMIYVGVSIFR